MSDNLNKPIGERNVVREVFTNIYGTTSAATTKALPVQASLGYVNSLGEGTLEADVVGIITTESYAGAQPDLMVGQLSVITNSANFQPEMVPTAYVAYVPGLFEIKPDAAPNSEIYKNWVKSLIAAGFTFKIAPSQSYELANIGDVIAVIFTHIGPPPTGGYYVGNLNASRGMSLNLATQSSPLASYGTGAQHTNLAAVQPRVGNEITDNIYVFGDSQTGGMISVLKKYFSEAKKQGKYFDSYYNGGGYNILNEGQAGRAAIKKYTYNPGDTIIIGSIGGNRSYDARQKYPNGKTITSQSFKDFASALQTYQNAGVKVIIFGLPYGGDLSRQADREYYDTVLANSLAPYGLNYISVMQGSKKLKPNNNDVHYGRAEASGYNTYFENLIRPTLDSAL